MKLYIGLAFTLMALGSFAEKTKGRKSFPLPSNSKVRQIDIEQLLQNQNGYEQDGAEDENIESESMSGRPSAAALKPDPSSGRMFFKKFFLLGKQTPTPQFIIITQPAPVGPTLTDPTSFNVDFTGTVSSSPIDGRGGDISGDYSSDGDDVYEDEIANEKPNSKKEQHTNYKLVKGKGNQQGLSIVVPSKYMRNFQNKRNSVVVNPSATFNNGASKVKKFVLSNSDNGNVKRKRSRNPVRRFIVAKN